MSEQAFVEEFHAVLRSGDCPWQSTAFGAEFYFGRGRTDVVILAGDDRIVAVEAKLRRWRDALAQAYRNTCFADLSYVLLPAPVAALANSNSAEFKKRGVGVCTLVDGSIVVIIEAEASDPVQPWLRDRARAYVEGAVLADS